MTRTIRLRRLAVGLTAFAVLSGVATTVANASTGPGTTHKAATSVAGGVTPGPAIWTPTPLPPVLGFPDLPLATPLDYTPGIVGLGTTSTNSAYAMAQCGGVDYLGGQFSQIFDNHTGTPVTMNRDSLFAFNPKTGVVDPNFHPTFKAPTGGPTQIESLVCSSDGTGLFIAGQFAGIDGSTTQKAVVRYNLTNDTLDTSFAANASMPVAHKLLIAPWGDLLVAGPATYSGQGDLASLNQVTGANTGYMNLSFAGSNPGNHYASYQVEVHAMDLSPTATPDATGAGLGSVRHLIITGTFSAVGGIARVSVAMIALTPNHPTMSSWDSDQFKGVCSNSNPTCVKAVVYPPANECTCFILGAAGGPHGNSSLWDGTSRFEQVVDKSKHNATWLNTTNGDSIYALTTAGPYVIIGGHEKWDNATAGPAGTAFTPLAAPGIGALNISNGKPARFSDGAGGYWTWNPLRSRGHGVNSFFTDPTTNALYVLSDGPQLGCADPGMGIDCTRPTAASDSGVRAKVASCNLSLNFPDCIGEPLATVNGIGAMPLPN